MSANATVAHYLLNAVAGPDEDVSTVRETVARMLDVGMWGVGSDEPHRGDLAAGDHVLIYLGAPDRVLVGRAVLGSASHAWSAEEARVFPGRAAAGVRLAAVRTWDPPVPMYTVLAVMDASQKARADFEIGVVGITATEFETALAVAEAGT